MLDINAELQKLTEKGYSPALVNDDNGKWALSVEGVGEACHSSGDDWWGTVIVESRLWRDTPEEAVMAAIEEAKES